MLSFGVFSPFVCWFGGFGIVGYGVFFLLVCLGFLFFWLGVFFVCMVGFFSIE